MTAADLEGDADLVFGSAIDGRLRALRNAGGRFTLDPRRRIVNSVRIEAPVEP